MIALAHRQETMSLPGKATAFEPHCAMSGGTLIAPGADAFVMDGNREVYQFMPLFPQPTRTRPSAEYVPVPDGGHIGHERD